MNNGPWGGYSNGNIPLSALVQITYPGTSYYGPPVGGVGGVYLEAGAAQNLLAMLQAYHAETGSYLRPNEGYRSFAGQQYYYDHPTGNGTSAPGYSNHGWGQAVDFDYDAAQRDWILAHGPDYGYAPLSGDIVHFNYVGPTGATPTPTNPTSTEDDMTTMELARQNNSADVYFSVNRITRYHISAASLTDYQFWMNQLKATNPYVNPTVQVVQNIASFGAVIG